MCDINKFYIKHPQIIGATAQNLVTWAKGHLRFVHPCVFKGTGKGSPITGHEGPEGE